MMRSLFSGVSGLTSHQTRMDVIGNNIANVNTYGYKSQRVTFRDIYYQTSKTASAGSDTQGGVNPGQIGYGTKVASIDKIMGSSSLASTSSSLDMALTGEGFFQVMDNDGNKYYTRQGNFNIDNYGNMVDANGYFVLGTVNNNPQNPTALSKDAHSDRITIDVPDVNTAFRENIGVTAGTNGADHTGAAKLAFNGDWPNGLTLKLTSSANEGVTKFTATTGAGVPNVLEISVDTTKYKTLETLASRINELIQAKIEQQTDKPGMIAGSGDTALEETDIEDMRNLKGGTISFSYENANKAEEVTSNDIAAAITALASTAGVTHTCTSELVKQDYSTLTSFSTGTDGVLTGNHPIWGRLTFGRVDLGRFVNPEGLSQNGTSYFTASVASGPVKVSRPGYEGTSQVQGAALEMSNVNLSNEMTDMITTQRGFQANSRTITVSDTMLEELINLKR